MPPAAPANDEGNMGWDETLSYRGFRFNRFAYDFVLDSIQNAINETSGIFRPVSFSEVNRFVDGHFWRDVFAVKEFEERHAKDVSVDYVNAIQMPVLRISFNKPI